MQWSLKSYPIYIIIKWHSVAEHHLGRGGPRPTPQFFNFFLYMCKYKYITKFKYKLQVGPLNYLHLHVYALFFFFAKPGEWTDIKGK